jgi:DNA-binding transcriptional LysR family regulator
VMEDLEMTDLRIFIAVAEAGSLSGAAERVNLVVPAVSRRMSNLEKQIGEQLLVRHSKGVRLTRAGEIMLGHARSIASSVQALQREFDEYARGMQGSVRLAATGAVISAYLPIQLRRFAVAHKDIRITLQQLPASGVVAATIKKQVELAIFPAAENADGVDIWPYRSDTLHAIVPTEHALASCDRVTLADLHSFRFVGLDSQSFLTTLLAKHGRKPILPSLRLRSYDILCSMIEAGVGIGILPSHVAAPYIEGMRLASIPLDESWARLNFVVGAPKAGKFSAATRLLHQMLTST